MAGPIKYARTDDGIVHIIEIEETQPEWGALMCGLDYGLTPGRGSEGGHVWVDLVDTSPTCIKCVASEKPL
jgi:hypothetical protein